LGFNGTLAEEERRRFKGECAHLSFNKGPIYTHDGAKKVPDLALTHTRDADPGCLSRILIFTLPGSWISDPDPKTTARVKKFVMSFCVATKNITKLKIILFFKC
jgi:hypothetical protein